jgi:hypothetical protein
MCSGGWLCSDTKLAMRLPPDISADQESVTRLDALCRLDPPGVTTG